MRLLLLALCALAACMPGAQTAGCSLSATQTLAFTRADAEDTVIVRALGPSCDKTVLVYTVHDEEGHPIWAWSSPLARAFDNHIDTTEPARLQEFLTRWAAPSIVTTGAAPEFTALEPGQTTLDQSTYDSIRSRNLPMLCHLSRTARETCVFWEPAAGGGGLFLERDVVVAEDNP